MVSGPHEDEDLWGEGDEGDGLDREWKARREEHFSGGYREGLEAGKQQTVQAGFNEGYALGAAVGFECGAARGAAATLKALAPRLPASLQPEAQPQQPGDQQQQQQAGVSSQGYQELQRQVCEGLMAGSAPALPPAVRAALSKDATALERLGLQALESGNSNLV